MKTKKLLLSILAPATILVPAVSAIALTSCNPIGGVPTKVAQVSSYYELTEALADKTIGKISLTNDIEISAADFSTGDYAILINRSVVIDGNGFMIYSENHNATAQAALVRIEKSSNPNELINVSFFNVTLVMKNDKSMGHSVVSIYDAEGCTVNFNRTTLNSQFASGGYKSYYALRIRAGIRRLGCTINISNQCEFRGWGAVYNTGSHVTLTAQNSIFVGANNSSAGDTFATITVSDYSIFAQHSLCAYNTFNFVNCILKATASNIPAEHPEFQQFVIQNRCPAHNIVNIDTETLLKVSSYMSGEEDPWFATALQDLVDINNTTLKQYWQSGESWDLPTHVNSIEAFEREYSPYNYTISHFRVNNRVITDDHVNHVHYYEIGEGTEPGSRVWKEFEE